MSRSIYITTALGIIALGSVGTLGCSMGAHPYDCTYAAYGGLIDRVDRVHGRVGSVLDPAEVVLNAEAETTRPEPTPAAEPSRAPEETLELPAPREAQLDEGRELIHVEQDGSAPEMIETHNTNDESLFR